MSTSFTGPAFSALLLFVHVFAMTSLFTWIGLAGGRWLPPLLSSRPAFAGPFGLALTTAWMGLLTEVGIAGKYAGGALLLAVSLGHGVQVARGRSAWLTRLLQAERAALLATAVPSLLAAFLMYRSSRFGDPWGSGDFFFFWQIGDYLSEYGGRASQALAQTVFDPAFTQWQIESHFRPGGNVLLSLFYWFVPGGGLYALINPLIVAQSCVAILALRALLETYDIEPSGVLIPVAFCPSIYFGLWHSYLAHSLAIVLLIIAAVGLDALGRAKMVGSRAAWGVGLIFLGAVLAYDNQFFILTGLILTYSLCLVLRARIQSKTGWPGALRSALSVTLRPGLVLVGAILIFSPQIAASMRFFAANPLPGWEWARLPAPRDFLGLAIPFGISFGGPPFPSATDVIAGAALLAGAVVAWRGGFRPLGILSLLFAYSVALLPPLLFLYEGRRYASHAIWKSVFLFPFLLPITIEVGVLFALRSIRTWQVRSILYAGAALITTMQLWYLAQIPAQDPWFGSELVTLVRKHMSGRALYVAGRLPYSLLPILRWPKHQRVTTLNPEEAVPLCAPETWLVWEHAAGDEGATVIDRAGSYRVGLPPSMLTPSDPSQRAWVLWGQNEAKVPTPLRSAGLVLSGPRSSLTATLQAPAGPLRVRVLINQLSIGERDIGPTLQTYSFQVPAELVQRCTKTVLIQVQLVSPRPPDAPNMSQALRIEKVAFVDSE